MEKEFYTISIVVDNESGVLARIVGLFASCQYNIDTLNVSKIDKVQNLSKITLTTKTTERQIDMIKKQLSKIIPVRVARQMEVSTAILRELALIKIKSQSVKNIKSDKAKVIHQTEVYSVVEICAPSEEIDALLCELSPLDISRTGLIAID